MDGGEEWLYRPILAGICSFDALLDPRYDLADFVEMNEAMDVQGENTRRFQQHNSKIRGA